MMTYKIEGKNITYTGGEFDGLVEFYNGKVREGYRNVDAPDWLGLEQTLRYSQLYGKALTMAKTDLAVAVGMNLFMITLSNGKLGHASENALLFAFGQLSIDWDSSETGILNGYLEANNFTIRLE
jgi:hypothetical protein